jgi:hypothetical protein
MAAHGWAPQQASLLTSVNNELQRMRNVTVVACFDTGPEFYEGNEENPTAHSGRLYHGERG